ncbi:MarR family transcriptional regulator [Arthrobacter sp. I2-34]|uniref:MarR family transcriptional regulator n=1 Tax=Arthrobacter hankyongi TaxID=2904801 RepID=A0ABS9L2T1_9MICC|nr:MarR family transcriptional regulator [Arthrobacter hankyongi]MCG2620915.1 MarR family transcriptional regulator [Arthrobacter hankyongi]
MAENRPIGFWLRLVDGLIGEQFESTVEEHGITRRQWQIMNVLAEHPATSSQLDESLKPYFKQTADESSAEHLDELIESGWVAEDNGGFALTDQGHRSLAALGDVVERNRQQATVGIAEEEYDAALDVLQRMARNLGWEG